MLITVMRPSLDMCQYTRSIKLVALNDGLYFEEALYQADFLCER